MKEDLVDRFSVGGEDHCSLQKRINLDEVDQTPNKGETIGCGKKKVTLRMLFSPKMKGKTHGSNATTGVGF